MEIPTSKGFWQPFLGFSIALALIAINQTQLQTNALLRIQSRYKWVVVMGVFALNVIVGAYLLFKPASARRTAFWDILEFDAAKGVWKLFGLVAVAAGFPLTWYVKF